MAFQIKLAAAAVTALAGAGTICPLCGGGVPAATAQFALITQELGDTATVKLHISGMTCGSCSLTARTALKRLPGVLDATVSAEHSEGTVRYHPRKVTPAQIATHLTRLTGYGARIIEEPAILPERPHVTR